MKTILSYFFCFLSISSLFAQKEANIWYFGANAGLDFNSGTPVALLDGALDTIEGCATISDTDGNLLFYTDGITVFNKNHTIMLNGMGLNGDTSTTQSALIVPKPNDENTYYIFTVADAIKIASINGAKAIGIENEVGSLKKGKKANLIIWGESPFDNIQNFASEKIIIKDGGIYRE
jgi:urease alpha subunit